jgi:CAAX protease family protein
MAQTVFHEPSAMGKLENNVSCESTPDSAPNFVAAAQPSYARTLFLGPAGLRAGWGFAFYLAMYYALQRYAGVLAATLYFSSANPLWSMMLQEGVAFLAAAIPALILSRIEHRPWGAYGLPLRQLFSKMFWAGAVWGFGGISLLLGVLYGLHAFSVGHLVLHGVRLMRFATFWAVMFLFVGLFEEFFVRGYSQFTLARGIGFWPAALVLSCGFGWMHRGNEGESPAGLLAVLMIGLFLCLTLRRTGNLWFALGFHAAWDWGETFFYSVPDSGTVFPGHLLQSSFRGPSWLTGGTVGPEGSALCFVAIAGLWIAFDRTYPPRASVMPPLKSEA